MKKHYLFISFLFSALITFAQPKVYINLNSHNEVSGIGEPVYDQVPGIVYNTIYPFIKQIADSVIAKQIKWNFQSEVRFLLGAIKYDPKNSSTGNLNLLKWMDNSQFIECDPHTHEGVVNGSTYNYADVAHLHDSLGVTNRRNVGGFKIDGLQNGSDWQNFENGMSCAKYTFAPKWKPYTLWGGSYNAGVHNDVNLYGEYKPESRANYTNHINTNRLAEQGNGCEAHFTDTTDENRIINNLKILFNNVHNGVYSATEFYTQTIQFDCRDIQQPNFIKRLFVIVDSVNHYVNKGWVEWKTITEKDLYWRGTLDSAKKYLTCSTLPTGINEANSALEIDVYPNPSNSGVFVLKNIPLNTSRYEVIDAIGRVAEVKLITEGNSTTIDISTNKKGIYFLKIINADDSYSTKKLLIE